MSRKYLPPLLTNPDALRNQINRYSGSNATEKSTDALSEVINHLYTSGWYYEDVIKHFQKHKFFPIAAERIATFVYTRGEKYNPFGYWYNFPYELPLEVLQFTKSAFNTDSLSTAGFLFSLILYYQNKYNISEKLDSAIAQHNENETKQHLISLRSKNDLLLIENPSNFREIAGISKYKRIKITELINSKLSKKITFYYENYLIGTYKKKLWIYDIEELIEKFERFRQNNPKPSDIFSKTEDSIKSGIDIFQLDELLLNDKQLLMKQYNIYIKSHFKSSGDLSYCKDRLRAKGMLSLEKMYTFYESFFKYNATSYLHHLPVETNPFLRIYLHSGEKIIACQSDFLNYNLLLANLYGIENISETQLLKGVAELRIQLILGNIGNHLQPISNPTISVKHKRKSKLIKRRRNNIDRHFEQIKKVSDKIDSISNAGIMIDVNKAKELLKKLKPEEIEDVTVQDPEEKDEDAPDDLENYNDYSSEDVLISELYKNKVRRKKYVLILRNILGSVTNLRRNGKDRIFGQFTPCGASTHRMTCRRINIQGIPKKLKELLFIAPEGKVLLSADITGQDIAVTANIARKLVAQLNNPDMANIKEKINYTVDCFSKHGTRPLLVITKKIEEFIKTIDGIESIIRDKNLKDMVKAYIYTVFYGGSANTILKEIWKQSHNEIITMTDALIPGDNFDFVKLKQKVDSGTSVKKMDKVKKLINSILEKANNGHPEYDEPLTALIADIEELITRCIEEYNKYQQIYNSIKANIQNIYPGLLEIFDYLKEYTENHPINLTYPTLLGWQTPVDEYAPTNKKHLATRSKSYPIQASGAELMREWVYDLTMSTLYFMNKFKIVAAIHDQVLIETDAEYEKMARATIRDSKDRSAKAVGLLVKTIIIPEVTRFYPKENNTPQKFENSGLAMQNIIRRRKEYKKYLRPRRLIPKPSNE